MAAGAGVVIDSSAGGLLRVEGEFSVGLTALDIAAGESEQRQYYHGDTETRRKAIQKAHDGQGTLHR